MSHLAKFICDYSNRSLDLAICNFQNTVRLVFFNAKFLSAILMQMVKIYHLTNFVAMGQTVAKLW